MAHASKAQMKIMTDFMEQHTDLAKSFSARGNNYKESHKMLWEKLSTTLNQNGPPTKATREWKRIWTTRKYSVKKKLVQNKNSLKQTGGGPFMELPLNTNEETIVQVCGIEAAIAGISGVSSYGGEDENLDEEIKAVLSASDKIIAQSPIPNSAIAASQTQTNAMVTPTKKHLESSALKKKNEPQIEESVLLARKQVELQERFLTVQTGIQASLDSMNKSINEVNESLKSLCTVIEMTGSVRWV